MQPEKRSGTIHTLFPLRYFIETPLPEVDSDEWKKLNWSKFEFGVTNKDGFLLVTRGSKGSRCELKIPGAGKLVGVDKGAEGGNLVFKPSDTNKVPVVIKKGNIRFIIRWNNEVYFAESLGTIGAIYHLSTENLEFKYKKVTDLDDEPEAFTLFNNMLLIASYHSFYRITPELKVEVLAEDTFWHGLFPTSIAVLDEHRIFIGLRGGYARISLSNNKLTFYKYTPFLPGKVKTPAGNIQD